MRHTEQRGDPESDVTSSGEVDSGLEWSYTSLRNMKRIVINDYIVADPRICHGKLTFTGTRIMVWQALEMLAAGNTVGDVHRAFPSLRAEHVRAALDYASSLTKEPYVILHTQPEPAVSPR